MKSDLLIARCAVAAVILFPGARAAQAQLPNASPAAFAMGGNFTAVARGYEAVAWNAANLAMPGRPGMSFGLASIGGTTGLSPVDFKTLHSFSGVEVDSATRAGWVREARLAGGESVRLDGGITPLALSIGPVGFQIGTTIYSDANLSPDAWEAFLFGNAGNNDGDAKPLDFTGTRVRVGAISTGALSFALPIPINFTNGLLSNEHAAVGITGKYVLGHVLLLAQDQGSQFANSDIQLRFPMIAPDSTANGNLGTGVGADLSFAWSGGPWRVGVLAENVFNTFAWDTEKLSYAPGTGSFSQGTAGDGTDFDQQPYASAPQSLRDLVEAQSFKPAVAVGAALGVSRRLTLTADMRTNIGGDEAIVIGPRSHFGVGAELRLLPFIPLRAGVASVTDGWQVGAGIGVRLLGAEIGLSASLRRRDAATESGLMLGLIGIGH